MEIGNDDLDDFYEGDLIDEQTTSQNIEDYSDTSFLEDTEQKPVEDREIIQEFLNGIGISDINKIRFVDEDDLELELSWDSLNKDEKLGILRTNLDHSESDLDDSEIELLNTIRLSKMSPNEYLDYVQQQGIQKYTDNLNNLLLTYQVNDLSDEDIYVADLLTRLGEDNVTDEEALHLLEKAKLDEALFKKQVEAIRNEYRAIEDNNRLQEQLMQLQEQVERYNKFAESVENEIRSFTNIAGYDLNMNEDEMEELYDFITGFDKANVSIFGKVLNDPKYLVKMAWFALNGEKAIQDINDYWTNEIKKISRSNKLIGKEGSKVAFKPSNNYIDDNID